MWNALRNWIDINKYNYILYILWTCVNSADPIYWNCEFESVFPCGDKSHPLCTNERSFGRNFFLGITRYKKSYTVTFLNYEQCTQQNNVKNIIPAETLIRTMHTDYDESIFNFFAYDYIKCAYEYKTLGIIHLTPQLCT